MNRSLADQMVWDFEDNRGDIAMVEEVLAMAQERIAVIPVFLVEGILKITHCDSVGGEHIGSYSDEGANSGLAMGFARIAFYQKLALVPADRLASGPTDLKLLNMDMFVPVHMPRFVEPELEDNVFASVTSQVQAEGIQTLHVKGIRCREDNIRIDGHRHHRCVGSALKQIEITHVQAWILLRKFGIEMMRHRLPLYRCVIDYSRSPRRRAIFAVRKCGLLPGMDTRRTRFPDPLPLRYTQNKHGRRKDPLPGNPPAHRKVPQASPPIAHRRHRPTQRWRHRPLHRALPQGGLRQPRRGPDPRHRGKGSLLPRSRQPPRKHSCLHSR